MNFGMYFSRNILSQWILFPARGHKEGAMYGFTNSTIFFSAAPRSILLFLTASVNPDYQNKFQFNTSTLNSILSD